MALKPYGPTQDYLSYRLLHVDAEGRYKSQEMERVIREDAADDIREAVSLGWIAPESRAFCGETLPQYCDMRNAPKCAAALRELGFPG